MFGSGREGTNAEAVGATPRRLVRGAGGTREGSTMISTFIGRSGVREWVVGEVAVGVGREECREERWEE